MRVGIYVYESNTNGAKKNNDQSTQSKREVLYQFGEIMDNHGFIKLNDQYPQAKSYLTFALTIIANMRRQSKFNSFQGREQEADNVD